LLQEPTAGNKVEIFNGAYDSASLAAAAQSVYYSGSVAEWYSGDSWTLLSALIGVSVTISVGLV
jgi:hypothetical protein